VNEKETEGSLGSRQSRHGKFDRSLLEEAFHARDSARGISTTRSGVQSGQLSLPFELLKPTLHNTHHRGGTDAA